MLELQSCSTIPSQGDFKDVFFELGMVVHAYYPSTQKAEDCEFVAKLDYIARPCLKGEKEKKEGRKKERRKVGKKERKKTEKKRNRGKKKTLCANILDLMC
jgi:hypothetical protein